VNGEAQIFGDLERRDPSLGDQGEDPERSAGFGGERSVDVSTVGLGPLESH
jgi:hypothetical protein